MTTRSAAWVLAWALACGLAAPAQAATAGVCFTAHGRLFAANGAPTFRIAVGRRVLGVRLAPGAPESFTSLPAPLPALLAPDAFKADILGDFEVCPLTPSAPGRMRMVRLVGVRHAHLSAAR